MPKISQSVRVLSAAASCAAYISPLASPADKRICVGGISRRGSSICRWQRGTLRERRRAAVWKMQFLFFVLQLVEPVVNAALRQQFLMRALFAQAAFVEDQDAVGVLNR